MKVHEILSAVPTQSITLRLSEIYGEEDPGYLQALERLLTKEPILNPKCPTLTISDEGYDAYYVLEDGPESYSITLTPEDELLGMDVSEDLIKDLPTAAAQILYWMCLDGFEESGKQELFDMLSKAIKDMEEGNDDMFVSKGKIKMHRNVIDSIDLDEAGLDDLVQGFTEELRKSGQLPEGFDES
jgi:hypothetical protein